MQMAPLVSLINVIASLENLKEVQALPAGLEQWAQVWQQLRHGGRRSVKTDLATGGVAMAEQRLRMMMMKMMRNHDDEADAAARVAEDAYDKKRRRIQSLQDPCQEQNIVFVV